MAKTHHLQHPKPGLRLDRFVAERLPDITRSHVKKLIDEEMVSINGKPGKPSSKLKPEDAVTVVVPDPVPIELVPEAIPLSVLFEDADLLVVDKPAGLTVHPGPGHPTHTLVNAILARCPDLAGIKGSVRPGIVHRLDKDTSGLIMIAKNDLAQVGLSQQIKERTVTKRYVALVKGKVKQERGSIEAPIGRDRHNRKRMTVVSTGRDARTDYRVLRRLEGFTLVEATLVTGRTHQIRVHLSSIGHPVVGDPVYGGRSPLLGRQFLHAAELRFQQPRTGAAIACSSPLPQDLDDVLDRLGGPRKTLTGKRAQPYNKATPSPGGLSL